MSKRLEFDASVVFIHIPHLKIVSTTSSYLALSTLHRVLAEVLNPPTRCQVLSSLTGAIIIAPTQSNVWVHDFLGAIAQKCKDQGVPIRLGVAFGVLEKLEDADGQMNCIGVPINIAARLALSDLNTGLLYDSKYTNRALNRVKLNHDDPLDPSNCHPIVIYGKAHDQAFQCWQPSPKFFPVLDSIVEHILPPLDAEFKEIDAVALAYDLPKFSSGQGINLSQRFRSVVSAFNSVRSNYSIEEFFFSPGGDGGIIVWKMPKATSIQLALDFVEVLETESENKDEVIDVQSRIGIHSGPIPLYKNAEGILRPTGHVCFIADEVASDKKAKEKGHLVITEAFKDTLFSGTKERLLQEYESLDPIDKGPAKGITRYIRVGLNKRRRNFNHSNTQKVVIQEKSSPHDLSIQTVNQGVYALLELMQVDQVRMAITTFRVVFQAACEQINIIAAYKALHDLLHTLEFQCYSGIVQEVRRFPEDETSIDILINYGLDMQRIICDVEAISEKNSIPVHEVTWLNELKQALHQLNIAIDELEIKQLKKAIWLFNRILSKQPSRINTNLNLAAHTLRLPALINAMHSIWEYLSKAKLNHEKVGQFQEGLKALNQLQEKLNSLIASHDYWQDLDLELRRIEANLEKDLFELEMSWQDLKEKTEVLFQDISNPFTTSLQHDCQNLDSALSDNNPVKVKRFFRLYRRRASECFFRVDVTLKRLCEELQKVGEPLASVLRMVE